MRQTIRLFLLVEAICFLLAGTVHSGFVVAVDIHRDAAIAETTIGIVLLIGFGLAFLWHRQTRLISIVAQAFALLGTLVGLATIIGGIGPQTIPDVGFHLAILLVLTWELVVATRTGAARSIPA